jgi:hypothetical protein
MLHKNYDLIKSLVDHRFVAYRRRCAADGLTIERIELWQELLEAGLLADRVPADEGLSWEEHILAHVERRYTHLNDHPPA